MDLELKGKRAFVTGGSKGIGKAIAHQLAAEGAQVAIGARDLAAALQVASELTIATSSAVQAFRVDTRDDASVEGAVSTASDWLGGIDILVNCAARPGGHISAPGLSGFLSEDYSEEFNTKVLGYMRCAKAVAPFMKRNGWGRIINISGLAARQTGTIIGSIRNVAVAAMTKNLADELGPFGINVTVVHPGITRTERTAETVQRRAREKQTSEQAIEDAMGAGTLLGRLVEANEVAYVVAFLASPKSVAITGDAVAVGGGSPGGIHY